MRRIFMTACAAGFLSWGCTMIPPAPSGRVLMNGQSTASLSGLQLRHASDQVVRGTIEGAKDNRTPMEVRQLGVLPLNFFMSYRRGLSRFGTEYGLYVVPLSFELSVALRQALRKPVLPEAWAVAVQGEALAAALFSGAHSLSASLAATRELKGVDLTLAVRGGQARHFVWGPPTGWGPESEMSSIYPFVDLVVSIIDADKLSRRSPKMELMARVPLAGETALQDSTYIKSNGNVSRYLKTFTPGPWLGLTVSLEVLSFTPYAARHFTVPRKWTPRLPPDNGDEALHLGRANELDQAGMPVDAADEYQAVLRINPRSVTAHIALARIYLQLDEAKMAYFHAGRAVYLTPEAIGVKELWEKAQAAMGQKP